MKKYIYDNREKIFNWVVLIIYLAITGIAVMSHEAYENEAQSFLIVRDLSIPQILSQLRYEGHSFLWYMVLVPFIKLGLPIAYQNFISWAFGIATVILILKKFNVSKLLKIIIIFSSGLLYFYTAIARTYAMIPLLLVLIALIYEKRDQHPYIYAILLALLANTHLIMVPTATMLAIFYWGKKLVTRNINMKKRDFCLSLLIFIIGLTLFGIIIGLSMSNMELVNDNMNIEGISNYQGFYKKIDTTLHTYADFLWGKVSSPDYIFTLLILALIFCLIGIIDDVEQGLIFWAQLLFCIIIHSFFWIIISERVMVIIYTLMFWILNSTNKENKGLFSSANSKVTLPTLALIIIVGLSTLPTYKIIKEDVIGNFSTGKSFASYIEKNIDEGATILCTFNTQHQPIIGYLPKDKYKFYLVGPEREGTYVTWNKNWNATVTDQQLLKAINKQLEKHKETYVLSTKSFEYYKYDGLVTKRLLSVEDVGLLYSRYNFVEAFNLYKVEKTT